MKGLDRYSRASSGVMAGLDPAIKRVERTRALPWIAASRAAMTRSGCEGVRRPCR